jgi:translation initiation factor IF-3
LNWPEAGKLEDQRKEYATTDEGVLSRPFPPRSSSFSGSFTRVNGKIRAREVRVIGPDNKQLGVMSLNDALALARQHGVDLVEIAATATPPVCRVVDFGKFRYEQAKRDKESKKHQHATTVKEVQLSPRIDPHDLGVKVTHAVGFLCEDMKVKVVLKFRGREMAHTEFGFQVIEKFLAEVAAYGHPDFQPKLVGRSITLMISPLPRNKRAKPPRDGEERNSSPAETSAQSGSHGVVQAVSSSKPVVKISGKPAPSAFANNPFAKLDLGVREGESNVAGESAES